MGKAPTLYPRQRKRSKKPHAPALYPRQRRKGKRTEIYIDSFKRNGKKVKGFWRKKK